MFEMRKQLIDLGVANERISLFHPSKTRLQQKIGFFTVFICEHCNMTCKGCNAFSPLVKQPVFLDTNEYERDIRRIGELFDKGKYIGRVDVMGGEPLLHPEINRFVEITRQHLPLSKVQIVTNGILLDKMPDEFWKCLKNNNADIYVSPYPIKLDHKLIQIKANEFGVSVLLDTIGDEEKTSYFVALDEYGCHDGQHSFENCFEANVCYTLKHGKFYTCMTFPYIGYFNRYFGLNFDETDFGADIYKLQTQEEIMKFLAQPVPLCKYCDVDNRNSYLWEPSKRCQGEWAIRLKGCK